MIKKKLADYNSTLNLYSHISNRFSKCYFQNKLVYKMQIILNFSACKKANKDLSKTILKV